MLDRAIGSAVAIVLSTVLTCPAVSQHIPPHSNDPHPPANQPAYQLPSPLSRPGVPGYPGAAHSNDPYYRKTEPRPLAPTAPTIPGYSTAPVIRSYPYRYSRQPAPTRAAKPVPGHIRTSTISLDQCYRNWDRGTGMSRASWQSTCRRLAVNGRVGLW